MPKGSTRSTPFPLPEQHTHAKDGACLRPQRSIPWMFVASDFRGRHIPSSTLQLVRAWVTVALRSPILLSREANAAADTPWVLKM
jgi:hypothetical protein